MLSNKLFVLLIPVLLTGCTVTGPADDGYERDNEWADNGRLLSNDAKLIYSSEKKPGFNTIRTTVTEAENGKTDYVIYQQWKQAKDKNSPEYQRFQKWTEFEEFQRWKAEQKLQ